MCHEEIECVFEAYTLSQVPIVHTIENALRLIEEYKLESSRFYLLELLHLNTDLETWNDGLHD